MLRILVGFTAGLRKGAFRMVHHFKMGLTT